MSMHEDLRAALLYFRKQKMRAFLAILGMGASIASIIVLVSIADAMRQDKLRYFREAGAQIAEVVLLDKRGAAMIEAQPHKFGPESYLRYDALNYKPIKDWHDAALIKERCKETVAALSPIVFNAKYAQRAKMSAGPIEDSVCVYGVTSDFFNCVAPKPVAGRVISEDDVTQGAHVAVLSWAIEYEYLAFSLWQDGNPGYDQLNKLYGSQTNYAAMPKPLMEEVPFRLNGTVYDVIGLLPSDCPVLEPFFRWNWAAFVPAPLERELTKVGATNRLIFYPKKTAKEAFAQLKPVLEEMYPGSTAVLHSAEQWAAQERRSSGAATTGFVLIGACTLLLSMVVIMNTMLVSVRERRFEIGIRKALGASRKDIARQFKNETLMFCVAGAAFGTITGIALTLLVELLQNWLIPLVSLWQQAFQSGAGGWSFQPRQWDLDLGVAASVALLGTVAAIAAAFVASFLPAREAAQMEPVACLRRQLSQPRAIRKGKKNLLQLYWLRPLTEDWERTFLIVSTVAVGVAVITVLASVGEYDRKKTSEVAELANADTIAFRLYGEDANWQTHPKFTWEFAQRLVAECPHVQSVWLECWGPDKQPSLRSAEVTIDDETDRSLMGIKWTTAVPGGMQEFYPRLNIVAGQPITQQEVDEMTPVCMLDEHAAKVLFPQGNALGNVLEVGGQKFTVKTILRAPERVNEEMWSDVRIPFSFSRSILGVDGAVRLAAHTTSPELAREEIGALYESANGVRLQERNRYFDMVGAQQMQAEMLAWVHTILIVTLGAGALFVAGVGVVNTMFVSVIARMKEMGIQRALGASRLRVARQYIWEAILLSGTGGLLGLLLGSLTAEYCLPLLYLAWGQEEIWPTAWSLPWGIIALLSAMTVGLLASLGPALKASYVRPASVLRSE